MARPRKVEDEVLVQMVLDEIPYAEIASEVGVTISGVNQRVRQLRRAGKLPPVKYVDHKWAIPWTIATEHQKNRVAMYLRWLSRTAQGDEILQENRNTALRWAQTLVDENRDVDYDRDAPPNDLSKQGGFFLREADPENWHLKMVLDKAKAGVLKNKKR
ncbi:winged helix-turn-helix domain-containing protein [Actinomadura sp. KC216]|uniref:winged helix-turn-helix domain-containing protein n=1 Tax=Actinomadura sp. KC216 TaxID=2530370 RepID=UPI0010489913|nr:winged helix-turn-helix domain-containing protein [Actinomadura sp. KC216]TDB90921.1 winged helix-turn-helix domain-containing protein [Actinomadura sp. KC216]